MKKSCISTILFASLCVFTIFVTSCTADQVKDIADKLKPQADTEEQNTDLGPSRSLPENSNLPNTHFELPENLEKEQAVAKKENEQMQMRLVNMSAAKQQIESEKLKVEKALLLAITKKDKEDAQKKLNLAQKKLSETAAQEKEALKKLKLSQLRLANIYFEIGLFKLEDTAYNHAISDFDKAIKMNDHVLAYTHRGRAKTELIWHEHDNKPTYQETLQDFNKAIEINPNASAPYFYRGMFYAMFNDYKKTLRDFDKAIEISPNKKYYKAVTIVYQELGRYEEALKSYETAEIVRDEKYYKAKAIVKEKLGSHEEARKDFEAAKKYPDKNDEMISISPEFQKLLRSTHKFAVDKHGAIIRQ